MTPFGILLIQFKSCLEVLVAFRDVTTAHQRLIEDTGILHRDVNFGSILLNPTGEEGSHGILIDLDHAVQIGTSPYADQRRMGTQAFMPRNVLQKGRHTYRDDLELFYYVLIYFLVRQENSRVDMKPHRSMVSDWDGLHALQSEQSI
ncbi:hypothetical protein M422DRAFT_778607 [Sphaerobolus stellatus SS14]|uniref:Protein kinase domain-containing protein n=1 Tax=Sphaerobolus stellatus (strain SS14) TaxID=990650 RepID=A0A0C9W470_SPHS4|nr:hypothetical protein M422DRAFT_778607 [Sphaerobolus stellatus SS14]